MTTNITKERVKEIIDWQASRKLMLQSNLVTPDSPPEIVQAIEVQADTIAALERLKAIDKDETAWLVEDGGTPARYRTMDESGIHWTDDVNKAIRFARRDDAEMFSAGDEDAWRITQHMWCKP